MSPIDGLAFSKKSTLNMDLLNFSLVKSIIISILIISTISILIMILNPGIYFNDLEYFHDFSTVIDLAHRANHGLISSVDYFNPIGPFFEWIYRLALLFVPEGARAIGLGNAFLAGIALLLVWLMLRRQTDPLILALVALVAITVAMSGRDPGQPLPSLKVAHLAPYNTWGWALLCPVAMRAVLPASDKGDWPGVIAAALALAAMFLLKVTYALGGASLIAAAMVLRNISIREGVATCAAAALAVLLANVITHGQVAAYLRDLREVAGMPDSGLRPWRLVIDTLIGALPMWAFSLTLLSGLCRNGRAVIPLMRAHGRAILMIGALGVASVMVSMQNHDGQGVPLLSLMPVTVISWAIKDQTGRKNWDQLWAARPEWLVAALLVILPLPVANLYTTLKEEAALFTQKGDKRFEGTGFAGLATDFPTQHPPASTMESLSLSEYQFWQTMDGWNLLKANDVGPDAEIAALNFTNPFPALMESRPLHHIPLWLNSGRDFSQGRHIEPTVFFAGVTYVMQARHDAEVDALMGIYGDYLGGHFQRRATSDEWILWVRKP